MINLTNFIVCIITHIIDIIVFSKLTGNNQIKKIRFIIIISFISLADFLIVSNTDIVGRIVISNMLTFLSIKIYFKENTSKCLMGSVLIFLGYVLAELIASFPLYFLLKFDSNFYLNTWMGVLITNSLIWFVYYLLLIISPLRKKLSNIIYWYSENNISNIINSAFVYFMCFIFMYNTSFGKTTDINRFVLSALTSLGLIIFIGGFYIKKSDNNKLKHKYNEQLKYSKIYKDEVNSKGKLLHEYSNQLLVLKSLTKKDKKAMNYIDELLDKYNYKIENDWIFKTKYINSSVIDNFITLKVAEMINDNILVFLNADKSLENNCKWKNIEKQLNDITHVLGVLLDNSMQATKNIDDRQVSIEILDGRGYIEFVIGNTYDKNIDLEKIGQENYTTKGQNHGYGLSLVEDIIKNNKLLSLSKEINGKFYVQRFIIKNKP